MEKNVKKKTKKKPVYITKGRLKSEYGFTDRLIERYLPNPILRVNPEFPKASKMRFWDMRDVERAMQQKHVAAVLKRRKGNARKKEEESRRQAQEARLALNAFGIEGMLQESRQMEREFILHVGPTNSGKTYDALQELKSAERGVYLGPLRLLALEVYDKLNAAGCPCTLLTGEEKIEEENARVTASTVEMLDIRRQYDVAVIDEAQMLGDIDRGGFWTKAILLVKAKRIHVCLAPEGMEIIRQLIEDTGSDYSVVRHERLTPLHFDGQRVSLRGIEKGDACIVFSRRSVLALAAELEQVGIRASVIYGALPPQARREEVRRFVDGETSVVVATDAIGMGISLPIRRILFFETEKFDGKRRRDLFSSEIRQIAGRAGRYGIYDEGFVLSLNQRKMVEKGMTMEPYPQHWINLPFPEDALSSGIPLNVLFEQWQELPTEKGFRRQNLEESQILLKTLGKLAKEEDVRKIYSYVTCPVDTDSRELVEYWLSCCEALLKGKPVPPVFFPEDTLQDCETAYKAYDIRHQMQRRAGIEESTEEDRERLCRKIAKFLSASKNLYLKHCSVCGKILPATYAYGICEDCFSGKYQW